MRNSLLRNKPINLVQQTNDFNIVNGNDSEILAASKILSACGAEIRWGSRNEDGRKIDFILSFEHPWFDKERIVIVAQVKSGPSYGRTLESGFKLMSRAKEEVYRKSHALCLAWVNRETSEVYWAYIHPSTTRSAQKYGKNHEVTPAMSYDLARCEAKYLRGKVGGKGVVLSDRGANFTEKKIMALTEYRRLGRVGIICPSLGKIEFTRIGWRHMLRISKSKKAQSGSLNVILNIKDIICNIPDDIFVSKTEFTEAANYIYRNCEYVLKYKNVKLKQGDSITDEQVVIRIIEEIRYPRDWFEKGFLGQKLDRRVVLLSAYHKKIN